MFAKLKKKIEEEAQTELTKSYQTTSATSSPNSVRKLGGRRPSASSTDSRESKPSLETSEDAVSVLRHKTEQLKRFETRLQEYYNALQQQLDLKAKLEEELEKQKLLTVTSVEKTEQECEAKIKTVTTEKLELEKKLNSAKMLNNSIIEKQQNIDELEGFQTQEMAKVKHLFLNCQQELQAKDEKISQLNSELEVTKSSVTRLESENKVFQNQLDKEEIEREKLKENYEDGLKTIGDLKETKDSLDEQVSKLKEELQETSSKYYRAEEKLAELRDKNDSINHSHELLVESTNKMVEEKSCFITHLEERVQTLEQRLADTNLNGDDQLNAVFAERDNLEKKLEESRQHLKIMLESELQIIRSTKENSEKDFNAALEKLKNEILAMEKKSQSDKNNYEKEINELAAMHREGREEIENLRTVNMELKDNEVKQSKVIEDLVKSSENATSEKTQIEKVMEEFKMALTAEKSDTEKLKVVLSEKEKELSQLSKNLVEENQTNERVNVKLKESGNEIINLQSLLETTEKEKQQFKEELLKSAELSQGAAEKSVKILELNKSAAALENELLERNKIIKLQQQRLSDMKKTLQRELKMQAVDVNNGDFLSDSNSRGSMIPKDANQAELMHKLQNLDTEPMLEDINFRYLKHVVLKFMTSREYESQHLIKAISVLLHFTPEEEGLIRDTLEWKMSWFGSKPKPKFGAGQMSKTISTT
uniref:Golgin subfamily A member 1 n=1 Tax=Strigamia maritima TaxID=126957 RepID=T1IVN2_STRMM